MNITVKKIALAEQHSQELQAPNNTNYLGLVNNIEVQCTVRIGTLNLTIAQLKELQLGQVLNLREQTNELVDILLENKVIARGELMSHEDLFAVQITEVCC